MSPPIQEPKDKTSATTLAELQSALENKVKEAADLVEYQADNKRQQGSLKQAIDVIEKNLAEFQKDGADLERQFDQLVAQAEHKLKCVRDQLGSHFSAVEDSLKQLQEAIQSSQETLRTDEKTLTGPIELAARNAARAATRSKRQFEQLRVKDLKDRISAAQGLLKAAIAISGNSPADAAEVFVLVSLAIARLNWSFLESDFIEENVAFAFPQSYEQQLVDAYEEMNQKAEDAVEAQDKLAWEKTEFDKSLKDLAARRASRKDDSIRDVRKAATVPDGKPPSKK